MNRWARSCLGLLIAFGAFQGVAAQERLVLGVPLEPPSLDPTSGAAAAVDSIVYGNIFEGLTRLTQSGNVTPSLAESWDVAADGLTYVFHLRRGVRFHDGTAFDADDVRFSLERALAPDSTNAQKALLSPIDTVEVLGPYTVQLTLHRPSSLLLWHLGWGDAVIVGEESASDNSSHPIGTGPFRFGSWQRGVAVR
ncbi:MAG: ABC transporter substrate-binding protein, partial [Woeseiaceae bacterium]|nr:ABC transporter substrate-binding protein [Woeseiaceae bacterium]